jgi:Bacterial PH domain
MNEHDYEPIPGLPAPLPSGESILWQGAPNWESLAYRAMRVRRFAVYFALLAVWDVAGGISAATPAIDIAVSTLRLGALALLALALLTLFAWLIARTTLYTITTRRVVLRIGIALPMTLQIPFRMIDAVDLRAWPDGTGDIALSIRADQRIGYLLLWPHARPWRIARPAPSLRSLSNAGAAAQTLGRALAANASQPAKTVVVPASDKTEGDSRMPAAA